MLRGEIQAGTALGNAARSIMASGGLVSDDLVNKMLAQRIAHHDAVKIVDESGRDIPHTPELITELFDQELSRIIRELPAGTPGSVSEKFTLAREISEEMITRGLFDPV